MDENTRRKSTAATSHVALAIGVLMLLEEGYQHVSPVQPCPEVAPYVVHIDAASKCFAATGLRVGWGVLPPYLQPKMQTSSVTWVLGPLNLKQCDAQFLRRAALSVHDPNASAHF